MACISWTISYVQDTQHGLCMPCTQTGAPMCCVALGEHFNCAIIASAYGDSACESAALRHYIPHINISGLKHLASKLQQCQPSMAVQRHCKGRSAGRPFHRADVMFACLQKRHCAWFAGKIMMSFTLQPMCNIHKITIFSCISSRP